MLQTNKFGYGRRIFCVGVLGLLTCLAISHSLVATIVFMDDFDAYTNSDLVGQGGWLQTGTVTTNPIQVAGGANKYAQVNNNGQDVYNALSTFVPTTAGNSIQTKFSINASAANAVGDYFLHLSSPLATTSVFVQRILARSSGGGFQLGITETGGGGPGVTYGSDVLNFGQDYLVQVDWNFVAGASNDTFTMLVDGNPYLTHTWISTNAEPSDLQGVNLRQGTAANAPTLQIDNLMVTAIPEPAICLLSIFVVSGYCIVMRQRK